MEMFCFRHTFFCDHIWYCVVIFLTKDDADQLQCVIGYEASLYLVMAHHQFLSNTPLLPGWNMDIIMDVVLYAWKQNHLKTCNFSDTDVSIWAC